MKIVSVVGARPQFIKAAAVSRELRKVHQEIMVHTGQHYDKNMSDIFFDELEIPHPDYNLGVGSKSHARQTAEIMIGVEDIILKNKPDAVLIYGDTNSTAAAAMAAGKLNISIAHVEAGLRTFLMDMPEEQNRIIADHLSTWNFVPSDIALQYLRDENIKNNVYNVGDVMYDALIYYSNKTAQYKKEHFFDRLQYLEKIHNSINDKWYLATIHRPENTDNISTFYSILQGLQELDCPVIFPVHPRIKSLVARLDKIDNYNNIHFVEPLGYIDMIFFAKNAKKIVTDSGGLHKESFFMKVPSVVILRATGWEETLYGNCNILAMPEKNDIIDKVLNTKIDYSQFNHSYYGNGTASLQIAQILRNIDS